MARLKPIWLCLDVVASALAGARRLHVAADFDGTLTPIVDHPDRARLSSRARRALTGLARLPGTRVALLSGRRLSDLRRRVRLTGAFLSGLSGLETLDRAGRLRVHLRPEQRLPRTLRRELAEWCARFPGAWLEDKRLAVALHYRAVPPGRRAVLAAGVRRMARRYPKVFCEHGKRVFDFKPRASWTKADALAWWLRGSLGPRADRRKKPGLLFFFGDDANDEPAYVWVRRRGGVTVAVGRRVSRAEYGVPTSDHVVWLLEWLEREWRARGPSRRGVASRRS
ncbi:MAG TPA: trehalose-phosphatase [Candidatus Eisenbacteria bacterium]